jgi:hypothetical protein
MNIYKFFFTFFIYFILLVVSVSCDLNGVSDEPGFVKFKLVIESDLDSLSVEFGDPLTLDILKTTITSFPWSHEYTDVYSYGSTWHIDARNDTGFAKFSFYSGDSRYDKNILTYRDSVKYYAPFSKLNLVCGAYEQINYNFKITTSDSAIFRLGYDAWWSDYDIDTLIINNNWHFYEFQDVYHKYKGKLINPSALGNSMFEFVSSGKFGRNFETILIPSKDTIKFQIAEGQLIIIQ